MDLFLGLIFWFCIRLILLVISIKGWLDFRLCFKWYMVFFIDLNEVMLFIEYMKIKVLKKFFLILFYIM